MTGQAERLWARLKEIAAAQRASTDAMSFAQAHAIVGALSREFLIGERLPESAIEFYARELLAMTAGTQDTPLSA